MNLPFKSGYKITQGFNTNPSYYAQFGLKGHEGIDIIPNQNTDVDIMCLSDGAVVKDEDSPRSGAYGIYVTIWHRGVNKATQYCHLQSNTLKLGDIVEKGQIIGKMGSTGNSTGPHLHLNLFETDINGYRLNKDNGYMGGIDPLPFIKQVMEEEDPCVQENAQLKIQVFDLGKEVTEAKKEIERLEELRKEIDAQNVEFMKDKNEQIRVLKEKNDILGTDNNNMLIRIKELETEIQDVIGGYSGFELVNLGLKKIFSRR